MKPFYFRSEDWMDEYMAIIEHNEKVKKLKNHIIGFCTDIGCSGLSPDTCPGSPTCDIVLKVMPWLRGIPYKLVVALRESK